MSDTRVLSRSRMTDGSLTPTLALAYLRELSLDVRAAVVLDAAGKVCAGDAELADRARTALAGTSGPGTQIAGSAGEALVIARHTGGSALAVVAGPRALLPLLSHDVEMVLSDVDWA